MMCSETDVPSLASELWRTGQGYELGKLLLEQMPLDRQPMWAARILHVVVAKSGVHIPLCEMVLRTAMDRTRWSNGHQVFDQVRYRVLELNELIRTSSASADDMLELDILSLAEQVAKVTYNATMPDDSFDDDSGWWIPFVLHEMCVHRWPDQVFTSDVWNALVSDL